MLLILSGIYEENLFDNQELLELDIIYFILMILSIRCKGETVRRN